MAEVQNTTVDSALNFALHTVDSEKLAPLFAKFGVKPDEICLQATIDLWEEYGDEFIIPFAVLAKEVIDNEEQMAEIKRHYLSIDRANGRAEASAEATLKRYGRKTKRSSGRRIIWRTNGESAAPTTDSSASGSSDKFDTAMNCIDRIFTTIGNGSSMYSKWSSAVNSEKDAAASTPAKPTAADDKTNTGSTSRTLIIVGVVLVVVLVVVLIVKARK